MALCSRTRAALVTSRASLSVAIRNIMLTEPRRAQLGVRVSSTRARDTRLKREVVEKKGCRRLLPVTWIGWLIFNAEPRNWLPASISTSRIYIVETAGSRGRRLLACP